MGEQTTSSTHPRLRMQGIGKRFGPTVALDGVDFAVDAGQVHALVGENGAGKSTLMKVLSGALRPDSGRMWLGGAPFAPMRPVDGRRSSIAMIYQELALAPHLSVQENIVLGMEPTRLGLIDWPRVRERARRALAQLGHGEIDPAAPVSALSVAARQLVEIARALASGAQVLVLDEPTSALGREDVQRLFSLIQRLRDQGMAIVYISHFLEEVRQVADHITILRDGRSVATGPAAGFDIDRMVHHMVGRKVDNLYPRSPRPRGGAVLSVRDLAGRPKPRSATLEVHRGEVLGIAGLVGAGRTELLRAIFGLDEVRKGQVRIGAYKGTAPPPRRWRQGAGMLSEDRKQEGLAQSMTVADNLTLTHLSPFKRFGLLWPRRQAAAAWQWITRLGIHTQGPDQVLTSLSGGNQQKVALGRLLHHDVDLLLLDEPTRGIDVASKAQVYQLIDELACNGKAVLMVSSYLPELLGVCDRIAVMCRGVLGPARPVEQCDEHGLMLEATGQQMEVA